MLPLTEYAINIAFIAGLIAVGWWLEPINGKRGFVDEWLAPFPLGISGGILLCAERVLG
jgi:hypothetical protein